MAKKLQNGRIVPRGTPSISISGSKTWSTLVAKTLRVVAFNRKFPLAVSADVFVFVSSSLSLEASSPSSFFEKLH